MGGSKNTILGLLVFYGEPRLADSHLNTNFLSFARFISVGGFAHDVLFSRLSPNAHWPPL